MRITYYVHDLEFPLREGVRKQAWWLAQAMKKRGHDVSIVSTSHRRGTVVVEGIPITYGNIFGICRIQTDVLHYISHPSPLILPSLLFARAKVSVMTMFDGELNGFFKRPWAFALSLLVTKKIKKITLQTQYQKRALEKTRVRVPVMLVDPIIPMLQRKGRRSKHPSLLFMSHLYPSKGIAETLEAYRLARKEIPELTLTVANSAIRHYGEKMRELNEDDVDVKRIVDPATELSKAWVYLYPILEAQETFSVPLSLIEAIQVRTPWISTRVGGIADYFDGKCLVAPGSAAELKDKIIEFVRRPYVGRLKRKISNERVIAHFEEIYES